MSASQFNGLVLLILGYDQNNHIGIRDAMLEQLEKTVAKAETVPKMNEHQTDNLVRIIEDWAAKLTRNDIKHLEGWTGGQDSITYAAYSTGALRRGRFNYYDSSLEHMSNLWGMFAKELEECVSLTENRKEYYGLSSLLEKARRVETFVDNLLKWAWT